MEKIVSMYEITKMMFEGKNDLERELAFEKFVKQKTEMEKIIIDDLNKKISVELDKRAIENLSLDIEKSLLEMKKRFEENKCQWKENYLDLPLKVFQNEFNDLSLVSYDESDLVFELHLSTDVKTGKLSIQYSDNDNHFLSHKEVIQCIKRENKIGKFKYE